LTTNGFSPARTATDVDCQANPDAGLELMFVDMLQQGRIDAGQMPALRPVFLKAHGIARGTLTVREDADPGLRCGIFAHGGRWPVYLRFSSDTIPQAPDFRTTLGLAMKLVGVPGTKLVGAAEEVTFDLILQNHPVFFLDTASEMCAFTRAILIDNDLDAWLAAHPRFAAILEAMAKPEPSVLAARYWSLLPMGFGNGYAKLSLIPALELPPLEDTPGNPDYLSADLAERLSKAPARFTLSAQLRSDPDAMPLDCATEPWDSPFLPLADLDIPTQDITAEGLPTLGEHLSFNIWRVTPDHEPAGSIAEARRQTYASAAALRRQTNGVPEMEPKDI